MPDLWGGAPTALEVLDSDRLERLLRAPDSDHTDLEVAVALARLTHTEYEGYGTSGSDRTNEESRLLMRALQAVLRRLQVATFAPPFRDFETFYKYWRSVGAVNAGGWQARRDILDEHFDPLHDELDNRETAAIETTLAVAVSPRRSTGWSGVDEELNEMRRHFEAAVTEQDYSNIGNDAVAVLEALSRAAYVHTQHGDPQTAEPPVANTKDRLSKYIEASLPGSENVELRKLVRSAIELAQAVKHRRTGDRRSAGMAADAVILVANLMRRIAVEH